MHIAFVSLSLHSQSCVCRYHIDVIFLLSSPPFLFPAFSAPLSPFSSPLLVYCLTVGKSLKHPLDPRTANSHITTYPFTRFSNDRLITTFISVMAQYSDGQLPPPPPPPPPRQPKSGDVGSLCPPPPPPLFIYSQHHTHHVQTQHAPNQNYGISILPQSNYQMYNYHHQQNLYNQQPSQYSQYSFAAPPPPPPPQHNHANDKRESGKQGNRNAAKKVNPKIAKKYSGRGLKTITISGPGMPTQRFKICVGNHPDDVKKWIEDRRKRFPRTSVTSDHTNSDVATGEKRDRLESLDITNKKQCTHRPNADATRAAPDKSGGALSSLLAGYDSSSSEEEKGTATAVNESVKKEDEVLEVVKQTHHSNDAPKTSTSNQTTSFMSPTRVCKYYKRGKCRHGDSCKFAHTKSDDSGNNEAKRKAQREQDKARRKYESELVALGLVTPGQSNRNGSKPVNNLLSKLLQRDKERERRLTLQMLRYIVDCDYFQRNDQELMETKDNGSVDNAAEGN